MKKTIIIEEKDRYTRLRQLKEWDQNRMDKARVMVIGCGALGNEVLKNLALVGTGRIIIVDFDVVEIHNLSRAILFREKDVGIQKVTAAAKAIKTINPDIAVIPLNADITLDVGSGIFRRVDVVIGCLDNREARLHVNRTCWHMNVPWVDGGLMAGSGQLRVFIPDHGPCYECTLTEKDFKILNQRYSCTGFPNDKIQLQSMPTGTVISSIIGAMQAQEAINIIHNIPIEGGVGLTYNSKNRRFFPLKFQYRKRCLAHERYLPIIELDETIDHLTVGTLLDMAARELGKKAVLYLDRDITTSFHCIGCERKETRIQNVRTLKARDRICPECRCPLLIDHTHTVGPGTILKNRTLKELGLPALSVIKARNKNRYCYFEITGDKNKIFPPETGTSITPDKEGIESKQRKGGQV